MSQWGFAFLAGVKQILERHVNEAEKHFKNFESMINSMTLEERCNPSLLIQVMDGPHSPWHVASVMPFTLRAYQSAKVCNAFK